MRENWAKNIIILDTQSDCIASIENTKIIKRSSFSKLFIKSKLYT